LTGSIGVVVLNLLPVLSFWTGEEIILGHWGIYYLPSRSVHMKMRTSHRRRWWWIVSEVPELLHLSKLLWIMCLSCHKPFYGGLSFHGKCQVNSNTTCLCFK
jgi:hypothetical protein